MRLNKLKVSDKKIFGKYLALSKHELSVYSFANIYIWRKFFDIRWAIIEKSLCVFFQDKIGAFLYLSPLAKLNDGQAVEKAFGILRKFNKNPELAHIENIEEKDLISYKALGYRCSFKANDYLCKVDDLARLQGDKFKSKRASCNYFIKHYDSRYERLSLKDKNKCLELYDLWMKQRQSENSDRIYQGMLGDSRVALKEAFDNYAPLGFEGGVVKIGQEVKGFTFGFALNPEIFCILYEITDLSVKGLAQFIFRAFSQDLRNYAFINIMDDSGLENLKKVKLSYHPAKLVPAYIVRRGPYEQEHRRS